MTDKISREEFIARFKAEPQLCDFYMIWNTNDRCGRVSVNLYGKYTYFARIDFDTQRAYSSYIDSCWNRYYDYTIELYNTLINHIIKFNANYDVPYFKKTDKREIAYKKYFPNLAAELPWKIMKARCSSTGILGYKDTDCQELQGLVYLEKWQLSGNYNWRLAIVHCQFLFARQ